MKKMILGVGLFLCGLILRCASMAVTDILGAMPDVHIVSGGIPVHPWAAVLMLAGAAVTVRGWREP